MNISLLCLSKIIKRHKHKIFLKNYMKVMQKALFQL